MSWCPSGSGVGCGSCRRRRVESCAAVLQCRWAAGVLAGMSTSQSCRSATESSCMGCGVSRRRAVLALGGVAAGFLLPGCNRGVRRRRARAQADLARAEADLARAQADAVRGGSPAVAVSEGEPEPIEYVDAVSPPEAPLPPATVVVIPPPSPGAGYVWIPGAYTRVGQAWVWRPGRYVARPRAGAVWRPGRWVRRGRRWVWVEGHWGG